MTKTGRKKTSKGQIPKENQLLTQYGYKIQTLSDGTYILAHIKTNQALHSFTTLGYKVGERLKELLPDVPNKIVDRQLAELSRLISKQPREMNYKELMTTVLKLLGAKYIFATLDDIDTLYLYEDGIYVPAKTIIDADIEELLDTDATTSFCKEARNHFKRRSYTKRTEFNKFDRTIPMKNGVLNLETLELTPHSSDRIFTFKLNTMYDPEKKAPKFRGFMEQILPNKESRQALQEFAGFTLLPAYPHHYFIILLGRGRNGKGAFIRTIIGILGADNVSHVPLENLDGKHRFSAANLYGKLMNSCSEPATKHFNTEILKRMTGQDTLYGEIKGIQKPHEFISFAKQYILANKLPIVHDTTLAFWDRLLLTEFTQTFTDSQGNKIPDIELQWLNDPDECSGILNWMLEGLIRVQKQNGFTQTKTMKQKKLEYQRVSDSISAFLTDENQVTYEDTLYTLNQAIFDAYKIYANELGIISETKRKLFSRLRLLPKVANRDMKIKNKHERVWQGIGLVKQILVMEEEQKPEEETPPLEKFDGTNGENELKALIDEILTKEQKAFPQKNHKINLKIVLKELKKRGYEDTDENILKTLHKDTDYDLDLLTICFGEEK